MQVQAEKLRAVQALAAKTVHGDAGKVEKPLHWYIMTSPFTHAETVCGDRVQWPGCVHSLRRRHVAGTGRGCRAVCTA